MENKARLDVLEDGLAPGRVAKKCGTQPRGAELVVHSGLDGAAQLLHRGVVLSLELWSSQEQSMTSNRKRAYLATGFSWVYPPGARVLEARQRFGHD